MVGGSARWLKVGPLPAVHPAEFAKLALIVYLAHWFAKRGTRISVVLGRDGPVPGHRSCPIVALVFKEPDLGTTMVIGLTGGHDVLPRRRQPDPPRWRSGGAASPRPLVAVGLRAYQLDRIRTWLDPWADRSATGFHTIQGLLALGPRRDPRGGPRREPPGRRAVPAQCQQRLHLRDHRRGVRADRGRAS